jgi:hypothetical protein
MPFRSHETLPLSVTPTPLTQALLSVVRNGYRPFQVVAQGEPCIDDVQLGQSRQLPSSAASSTAAVPLLQDRGLVQGQAAAYVCDAPSPGRAFACQAPITTAKSLEEALGAR